MPFYNITFEFKKKEKVPLSQIICGIGFVLSLIWCLFLFCGSADADPAPFEWSGIVVHHSATETGTVESFRQYHVGSKKWDDIAYHYVIYKDGSLQYGRRESKQGMHGDKRNWTHLGICLVGNNNFTLEQKMTLAEMCKTLTKQYDIKSIECHHEECPGDSLDVEGLEREVLR